MDPLSVIASITGLLAAVKITTEVTCMLPWKVKPSRRMQSPRAFIFVETWYYEHGSGFATRLFIFFRGIASLLYTYWPMMICTSCYISPRCLRPLHSLWGLSVRVSPSRWVSGRDCNLQNFAEPLTPTLNGWPAHQNLGGQPPKPSGIGYRPIIWSKIGI